MTLGYWPAAELSHMALFTYGGDCPAIAARMAAFVARRPAIS